MSLPAPEIVTLVTHHPDRPVECLERCVESLVKATTRPHLIQIIQQGGALRRWLPVGTNDLQVSMRVYKENLGPTEARIDSIKLLKDFPSVQWWAKLDDDGEVPEGCWDKLIIALEANPDAACAMSNPNGQLKPRMLRNEPGVVLLEEGSTGSAFHEEENLRYWVCTFVGDGCTVFRREVFDEAAYDSRFIRGADVDLAVQLDLLGWDSLLVDEPSCIHRHKDCSPEGYDRLRYDAELVWDSAEAFREKWGRDCPHLSQFGRRV